MDQIWVQNLTWPFSLKKRTQLRTKTKHIYFPYKNAYFTRIKSWQASNSGYKSVNYRYKLLFISTHNKNFYFNWGKGKWNAGMYLLNWILCICLSV